MTSSESEVEVEYGEKPSDTAVLLLAAAEELGLSADVVKTREGGFLVPAEVNEQAFGKREAEKPTAKKAAAKKSTTSKNPQE